MSKAEQDATLLTEGLAEKRTVVLSGEISNESAAKVGRQLLMLQIHSSDPINLIISSGGGNVHAALELCDLMSTVMTAPIRGIALGLCGSAATFIMLHCNERIATPFASFLIHSGSRSKIVIPVNQSSSTVVEQLLEDVKASEETILTMYMNRLTPFGWSSDEPSLEARRTFVQSLIDRGDQQFNSWMTAKEAKHVGLIERIEKGKLGIF